MSRRSVLREKALEAQRALLAKHYLIDGMAEIETMMPGFELPYQLEYNNTSDMILDTLEINPIKKQRGRKKQ